jgi:hypothetical protein
MNGNPTQKNEKKRDKSLKNKQERKKLQHPPIKKNS